MEEIRCPKDVRRCPNGLLVGRDPRNGCKFKECRELTPYAYAVRPTGNDGKAGPSALEKKGAQGFNNGAETGPTGASGLTGIAGEKDVREGRDIKIELQTK